MSSVFKGVAKIFKKVVKTVKKILPVVLVAAAVVFTAGAALGALPGTFATGGFWNTVMGVPGMVGKFFGGGVLGNVVAGAITQGAIGTVIGGVTALATGGDIKQGMLTGAMGGAITGATTGLLLGTTGLQQASIDQLQQSRGGLGRGLLQGPPATAPVVPRQAVEQATELAPVTAGPRIDVTPTAPAPAPAAAAQAATTPDAATLQGIYGGGVTDVGVAGTTTARVAGTTTGRVSQLGTDVTAWQPMPKSPGGPPEGSALSRFFAGTGAFLERPGVGEAVQAGLTALGAAAGDDGRAEAAEIEQETARQQLASVRANYGAAAPRPGLIRQRQYVSPAQDDDGGAGGGVRWTWDGATRQFARQTFA